MIDELDSGGPGQRRRYARRAVQLQATLRIGAREISALTENVSPGGAFLSVSLPEDVKELVASIGLPHGRDLHVRAKVRWRRAQPPGVGIEFETFLEGPQEKDLRKMF